MKITRNEPDTLQLQSVPWFFGYAIVIFILAFLYLAWAELMASDLGRAAGFLAIAIIIGGGGFCLFVKRSDVVFNSTQGTVEISERSVLGAHRQVFELGHVVEASLESVSAGGGKPRRRIVLNLSNNEDFVPLTRNYFVGQGMISGADAINTWLAASRR